MQIINIKGCPDTPTPPTLTEEMPRILARDSNWHLYYYSYHSILRWTSNYLSESAMGSLDFGPFTLGETLYLALCGGGSTRGHLKSVSLHDIDDGTPLISKQLGEVLTNEAGQPVDVQDPYPCRIGTSAFSGARVFLRLTDSDDNSGWAWIGANLNALVVED